MENKYNESLKYRKKVDESLMNLAINNIQRKVQAGDLFGYTQEIKSYKLLRQTTKGILETDKFDETLNIFLELNGVEARV